MTTPLVPLLTIAGQWGRIGATGFGGPPAHIALFRKLCVEQRGWLDATEFEDGIAAANLLPGPASTQLAIFCAWRLRGWRGAVIGGLCFIVPGLVVILALAVLFLSARPPLWVLGAAAGAGAAVPAVALQAGMALIPASWKRIGSFPRNRIRWVAYFAIGLGAGAIIGAWVVVVALVLCGAIEILLSRSWHPGPLSPTLSLAAVPLVFAGVGSIGALSWVALKVGLLSYGGGFVIVPLMQQDAVDTYHWMSGPQFLNAVALGQVTPGPVLHTVAVVGYAAAGIGGGLLAALVAFAPSFVMVIVGARYFDRLRANRAVQAFLTGAGAAVIGAIVGSAVPLGLELSQLWQLFVLGGALVWLVVFRRGVVSAIVAAAAVGVIVVLVGAPV